MQYTLIFCIFLLAVGSYAQITQAGKDAIVSAHNTLRSKIAKGTYNARGDIRRAAINMKSVGWNDDYAIDAYRSIAQCPANIARPTNGRGANIKVVDVSGTQVADDYAKQAIAEWENQFQEKGWPENNTVTANLATIGLAEATQMAYWHAGSIGCASQKCGSKVATVCHYSAKPTEGQQIYTMGPTCSRCPDFYVCNQATGLCNYQNTG
ncbi:hypothetical protein GCK72_020671 [Caenorhabditis remanei]|uniref:SCP domain-containing protein n=1 Tax=Caenorhabditis remanei TaxID=31234 RepID=A0A6A5GHF0_CAERE|nr:hypothetical protein GCK72_020671 [Caenorhabditis remanei]KAF1754113.1 hypothetical protein GCK72_020671 [Caenorhabditis remanei]